CAGIVDAAREAWQHLAPALPVPAGGMAVERVPEMRARFGDDVMLLIGGSLLMAGDQLFARCREFVAAVRNGGGNRRAKIPCARSWAVPAITAGTAPSCGA